MIQQLSKEISFIMAARLFPQAVGPELDIIP